MSTTATRHLPLDPRTLGRPVHLLPRFAQQLGLGLAELFRPYNRRYRTEYRIGEISIKPLLTPDAAAAPERWLDADGPAGLLACLLPRPLLLSLMAQRYGRIEDKTPETATEERLRRLLGHQLVLQTLQQAGLDAETLPPLRGGPRPALPAGSWLIRVPVQEAREQLACELLIALDGAYIDGLLKRLAEQAPARGGAAAAAARSNATPLPRRLQLRLSARLLEQTLPLGELLSLKPGDLVPVRLKDTEVLVDGSPLFSASVAEHQGKLCLTSFEDIE